MIQRIQTLYLALAAMLSFSLFWKEIHFAKVNANWLKTSEGVFADGTLNIYDSKIAMVLAATTGVLALVSILLFRNRRLQSSVVLIGEVAAWLGIVLSLSWAFIQNYAPSQQHISFGIWVLLAIPLLMYLAIHNIHKDERLVRSSDRLR